MEHIDPEILEEFSQSIIYEVVGYISQQSIPDTPLSHLGGLDTLDAIIKKGGIDEVFYINGELSSKQHIDMFEDCRIF